MTLVGAFFHFSALFALMVSFIALALTRLSIFHSWLALALAFAGVLILWIRTDILKILTSESTLKGTKLGVVFPLLLATATFVLSFFFPIFQLSGGSDEGNYFIQSVQIARTGALNLDLEVLRDPEIQSLGQAVKGGYPGIYSARNRGY
ncbi:MAG TPA: hypothetical protein VMY18_00515, partial [Acidobacteriota bacterium]|nr:hypothetical protein [Acidobacteriota bacterium]